MPLLTGLVAAELPSDAVEVGRIVDGWGVKGWFKVQAYSADPAALFSAKSWFLLPPESGARSFSGAQQLLIQQVKHHSDSLVACAGGIDDRDAADGLRGARIFVSRASFPAAGHDEYYWVDLIGLDVVNREGLGLGQVRDLLSTGAQTVLLIDDEVDGKVVQRMIPFVGAYIDDVDLGARRIQVDWQADY